MSSGHQSDSEDADESQGRPDSGGVSDKDEEQGIEDSDVEDDIAPVRSSSPPGSCGDRTEGSASSPAAEAGEREAGCKPTAVPRAGSGGVSSTDGRRGNSLFSWLKSRLIRRGVFVDPARDNFRTMTSLYCSMNPAVESVNLSTQTHGAVFNLEYSPDG